MDGPRTRRVACAAACAAAAGLGLAAAGAVPQQGSADQQRPTFRTAVNFVRVDVFPRAGGRPVADLRGRIGAAGRDVVERRYCSSRIVPQYERFYEAVLARPATGAFSTAALRS